MKTELATQIAQGLFLLLLSPAFSGGLKWWEAFLQGRQRSWVYIFQPYLDLYKLMRLPAVRPQTSSWVFSMTPWVVFVAYALLAFMFPIIAPPLLAVDLLVIIYLLGLTRFTLSLAGWDAGAPFGGLGGSREMFFQFLTEIGFFAVLIALALRWSTLDVAQILNRHMRLLTTNAAGQIDNLGLLFLIPALAAVLLFETERIPIDNPSTHLELTMSSKAVLLEFAGRDLALVESAEGAKFTFLLALFSSLFIVPYRIGNLWDILLLLLRIAFLVLILGWWETNRPKLRLGKVAGLAGFTIVFALIGLVLIMLTRSAG